MKTAKSAPEPAMSARSRWLRIRTPWCPAQLRPPPGRASRDWPSWAHWRLGVEQPSAHARMGQRSAVDNRARHAAGSDVDDAAAGTLAIALEAFVGPADRVGREDNVVERQQG